MSDLTPEKLQAAGLKPFEQEAEAQASAELAGEQPTLSETLQAKAREAHLEIIQNREKYLKAWIAEHGLPPSMMQVYEQRTPEGIRYWVEPRKMEATNKDSLVDSEANPPSFMDFFTQLEREKRQMKTTRIDQLIQLTRVTWDGDLISKPDRRHLVNNGLAKQVDGYNVITPEGIKVLKKLNLLER